jgi:hypothetical protein
MITAADFYRVLGLLGDQGCHDVAWSEGIVGPTSADEFALEVIFVICNSGMKNTIARQIFDRCVGALKSTPQKPIRQVFGHAGKAAAMEHVWKERVRLLREYQQSDDKLAYLVTLPWIGNITKYHLAKNFGEDFAKPDVHLQRLADLEGCTPQALCERLAVATGLRVGTVDTVLWRACANGVIDSRRGFVVG